MSEKGKSRREAYQAKQEEKGKLIIKCIIGGLIVLAVAYLLWITAIIG